MKQISKVFIAVGLGIMFLGGMLDADGENYILLLIAMALGALVGSCDHGCGEPPGRKAESILLHDPPQGQA